MNPETLLAVIGSLAVGGFSAEFLLRLKHPMANALVFNLTLVAGSGVLMAMGGMELAGRYGYTLVIAMIAFTLIFLFSPLIFFPLRRLVEVIKFATLVDFLTFSSLTSFAHALADYYLLNDLKNSIVIVGCNN